MRNEPHLPFRPSQWWHNYLQQPERRWAHRRAALAVTRSPVSSASRGRCHSLDWRSCTGDVWRPDAQSWSAGSVRHRGECQRQYWRRRLSNHRHWKSLGQTMKYSISHYLIGPCEISVVKSKNVLSEHILRIKIMSTCDGAFRRMTENTFDDKSSLVQVKALCCQVTGHYLCRQRP